MSDTIQTIPAGDKHYFRCTVCLQTSGPPVDARYKFWEHACTKPAIDVFNHPCKYLGEPTGTDFTCKGCPGSRRVHAEFACQIHGKCLPLTTKQSGITCCPCAEYKPIA